MRYAAITGWGMAVPERVLTNADLERMVDTSDEWIVSRTGIRERRVVGPNDSTTSLAVAAARQALDQARLAADDIDLIVVATCTPDQFLVSQACLVQAELGGRAGAFDLGAACAGFVSALAVGSQFIQIGGHDRVLVIGADTLSRFVDYTDRSTCILFGDGAGAVVLQPAETGGFLGFELGADGAGGKELTYGGSGSRLNGSGEKFLRMNGREVFKFATRVMVSSAEAVLGEAGKTVADVDVYVPHQANVRIIDHAARKLGVPEEKVVVNVDRYGNTSSGSIPLALADAADDGRLKPGKLVLMTGMGAGLTWGSALIEWTHDVTGAAA
jgi:3-oxoacyl-[acyl-carrier-protein] synthase-3